MGAVSGRADGADEVESSGTDVVFVNGEYHGWRCIVPLSGRWRGKTLVGACVDNGRRKG